MENPLLSHIFTLILLSVVAASVGFGFQRMLDPDMIFGKYGGLLRRYPNSKWFIYLAKPLGLCIICNSTWIGIILTFVFMPEFNWFILVSAIVVGCMTAGIVAFISMLYHLIKSRL